MGLTSVTQWSVTRKAHRAVGLGLVASCAAAAPAAAGHVPGCNTRSCDKRVKRACLRNPTCHERVRRKAMHRVADPFWGIFNAIATCEWDPQQRWATDTGNGYFGGIQFSLRSWYAVGGRGNPAHTSKLEQIYRGVLLMRMQGWGAWPQCRRVAGV